MAAKRSLFSKPKWAAAPTDAISTDRPFFKQAVQADASELIRQGRERKQQQQQQRNKEIGRKSHELHSDATDLECHGHASKKLRRSPEVAAQSIAASLSDENDEIHQSRDVLKSESAGSVQSSRRSSRGGSPVPQREEDAIKREHTNPDQVNTHGTDDDDEEDVVVTGIASILRHGKSFEADQVDAAKSSDIEIVSQLTPAPPESDADSEDDDYLRELRRRARAEAAQKERPTAATAPRPASAPHSVLSPATVSSTSGAQAKICTTTSADDPEVQILIRSIIPNTSEVIVRRLASQPLDKVHAYWCERNEIPNSTRSKIFFIWRLQKLFNTTTMRGILRQIERTHGTKSDGSDLSEGKIVIEAVTQEILEHRVQQRKRDVKETAGLMDAERNESRPTWAVDSQTPIADSTATEQRQAGMVVTLVAPNMAPFKLRVRADTVVGKIIRGYRSKNGIAPDREMYLVFDGEKLDNDLLVGDSELEDGDSIDVRIASM